MKKIISIIMTTFTLLNCVACSNFSRNDTEQMYNKIVTINETTSASESILEQKTFSVCAHSNGGDPTSNIIDDKNHENGIICFDCNEVVWTENFEEHDLNSLAGACVCGYICEHGYDDNFHYEITEEGHKSVFVCNTCQSVIHEESEEHFVKDGACTICGH